NFNPASSIHRNMASQRPTSAADGKTYFEQQRELLIGEIAMSFEQVLANINKLNRSLEAVITVGNEFSSVEALWSQFEGVMGGSREEASRAGDDTTAKEGDTEGATEGVEEEETRNEEGETEVTLESEEGETTEIRDR
ncbi:hypothetical protein jhhlp_002199, partial [Lomentospora prolificans]